MTNDQIRAATSAALDKTKRELAEKGWTYPVRPDQPSYRFRWWAFLTGERDA